MKRLRLAVVAVFGMFLLAVGSLQADDQTICTNLTLNSFSNSIIRAGYRVTDVGANWHECTTTQSSNHCNVCAGAKSYPKNVGNYLCIPNELSYSITQNCKDLLNSGAPVCSKNNVSGTICGPFEVAVEPVCNWRTNENSTVAWNWNLTWSDSSVSVDCSIVGYQGPTPE
jgi:hypothetical protein